MTHGLSRRQLLENLGYGATALAVLGHAPRAFAANDTIGVGLIGCGGRMHIHLAPALQKLQGIRIVAACDTYSEHRKSIAHKVGDTSLWTTQDHHELLARQDVDAVVIATPDHLHVPLTIDACNAGKDVYCEKPFTHNLKEGTAAVEAQDRNKRVVQIGTQQRSMPHLIEARKVVESGVLGPIRKVRMTWNRNARTGAAFKFNIKPEQVDWKRFLGGAPDQPFNAQKMRHWRWFWDFGGGLFTDLMVHWYDTVNWMLDLGRPTHAAAIGDFLSDAKGVWETPDTVQGIMRFADRGVQAMFESTFINSRDRAMTTLMGEDATLYFDRGRFELKPEPGRSIEPRQMILGSGEPGQDFFDQPDGELLHITNWIESIRSRVKPVCPAEAGVEAAATAQICNIALREQRVVQYKPEG